MHVHGDEDKDYLRKTASIQDAERHSQRRQALPAEGRNVIRQQDAEQHEQRR